MSLYVEIQVVEISWAWMPHNESSWTCSSIIVGVVYGLNVMKNRNIWTKWIECFLCLMSTYMRQWTGHKCDRDIAAVVGPTTWSWAQCVTLLLCALCSHEDAFPCGGEYAAPSKVFSNRNEYPEYFVGAKGSWCIGLTILPPSCADCLEIWEPQPLGTLRGCADL
jgi:hypothetical protein